MSVCCRIWADLGAFPNYPKKLCAGVSDQLAGLPNKLAAVQNHVAGVSN